MLLILLQCITNVTKMVGDEVIKVIFDKCNDDDDLEYQLLNACLKKSALVFFFFLSSLAVLAPDT